MNLGSVMLCDLLGDKAEAEVVNSEVIVQVVEICNCRSDKNCKD